MSELIKLSPGEYILTASVGKSMDFGGYKAEMSLSKKFMGSEQEALDEMTRLCEVVHPRVTGEITRQFDVEKTQRLKKEIP